MLKKLKLEAAMERYNIKKDAPIKFSECRPGLGQYDYIVFSFTELS